VTTRRGQRWEALVPRERVSLLQLLIERIDYDPKEVGIRIFEIC
jgi:hypothetical protein